MNYIKINYITYFKINKYKKFFKLLYLLKIYNNIKFFNLKKKKKLYYLTKSPKCYKKGKLLINFIFFNFFLKLFLFKKIILKKSLITQYKLLKKKYLFYQTIFLNNFKILINLRVSYSIKFLIITIYLLYYFFYKITEIYMLYGWAVFFFSFLFMFLQVLFFTTCERKILALTQRRVGPKVVGDMGRLQYFADALKLIFKTYTSPRKINSTFFTCSSLSAFWISWYGYSNLSFNYGEDIAEIEYNIFYFIVCSLGFSIAWLVSGWSSTSKYALLGCIRAGLQIISYEILMSGVFLILFAVTGTTNFEMIMNQQINLSIFFFLPLVSIIAFITTLMETNRPPFDLSEAESDVVAGYTIEYTGILFGLFYLGEYVNLFVNSFIIVILFSGGYWNLFTQFYIILKNLKIFFSSILFNFEIFYNISSLNFFFYENYFFFDYIFSLFSKKDIYQINYKNNFVFNPLY